MARKKWLLDLAPRALEYVGERLEKTFQNAIPSSKFQVSSEALAFANFAVGSSHLKASDTEQLELLLLLLANLPP